MPPPMPEQQSAKKQQIPSIKRNHAHHGQPPPSVEVVVVVVVVVVVAASTAQTTAKANVARTSAGDMVWDHKRNFPSTTGTATECVTSFQLVYVKCDLGVAHRGL